MQASTNFKSPCPVKRSAQFRFYEELNDFLPLKQRRKTFRYDFSGEPSVKDTVEAIGVPHTEVDLILVNGKSVDFRYQMQGGERVAVYPVFEAFDISSIIRLRPKPLRKIRFVVDADLGKLARFLRLLGFDTLYHDNFDDRIIMDVATKEKRIILTRDRKLLKHDKVTHGYWVRNIRPRKQLHEVVSMLQLENSLNSFKRDF